MSPATGELVSHIQKCIAGGQLSEAEKLLLGYLSASQSRSSVHEQWARLTCDLIAAHNSKSNFARAQRTLDKALSESHVSLKGPYLDFANHLQKAATSYRRNAPQHAMHLLRQAMSIQFKFRGPKTFSTFQQLGAIYYSHIASLQKKNLKSEARDTLIEFQAIVQAWMQAANKLGDETAIAEAYTYLSATHQLLNNKSEARSAFQKALNSYGTAVCHGDLDNTEAFHVFLKTADTLNYPGNSRKSVQVIKDKSRRAVSSQSSAFPSTEHLADMMQQAIKNNIPASLSFAGMHASSEFVLSCFVDDTNALAHWEICVIQDGEPDALETLQTGDVSKVHKRLRQAWKSTVPSLTKIELSEVPIAQKPEPVRRTIQESMPPMKMEHSIVQSNIETPQWKCDKALLDKTQQLMRDPDSGLISFPFFLYFLEQEFERARFLSCSLSLAILDIKPDSGKSTQTDLHRALETLRACARKTDYICVFENNQYAVIMPSTNSETAELILARIGPMISRLSGIESVVFGVATSPSDTIRLESLVSCAQEAHRQGRLLNQSVFSFINMAKELSAQSE